MAVRAARGKDEDETSIQLNFHVVSLAT
jgi:hypothetical protein